MEEPAETTFEDLLDGVPLAAIKLWTRYRAIRCFGNGCRRSPPKAVQTEFRYVPAAQTVHSRSE